MRWTLAGSCCQSVRMCGRFAHTSPDQAVLSYFSARMQAGANLPPPRWNIRPTQDIAVVRLAEGGWREAAPMRWGFVPQWYASPSDGPLIINARSETLADKPAFRQACRNRRCLIPTDGFYEWQKANDGGKDPWFIARTDGAPLVMAGVWQEFGGGQMSTAIVTCAANDDIGAIHDRMPVIVPPGAFGLWLGQEGHGAARLMQPAAPGTLTARRVARTINGARDDHPGLNAPLDPAML